jgi:hypothetical protein
MASTVQGRLLTRQHRQAQARLNALTAAQVLPLWRLLGDDPMSAPERWLSAALAVIQIRHSASVVLAERYFQQYRSVEIGGPVQRIVRPSIDIVAARSSLMVTGPVAFDRSMRRGESFTRSMNVARAGAAATAGRIVLNGGRDLTVNAVSGDRRALGWARVTSGNPCAFCALLAGRGPVYGQGADFQAHDNCSCTAEPVYSRDAAWPDGSRRFAQIYEEHAQGQSDPLNAFRRAYERPPTD